MNTLSKEALEEIFNSDDKCLEYLSNVKWENGFICRKCGNDNFCPGKVPFSRRCTRCKNEESSTANTIFHNCKFPVSKAFYIAYSVLRDGSSTSSHELAQKLDLKQMTCWKFKNKVEKAIDGIIVTNNNKQLTLRDLILGKDRYSEMFNML